MKDKKYIMLKILAIACLCILFFSIVCLITSFPYRPKPEPITISTSSADEAAELFGDDLPLRQFAEIDGGNGTARYTLTLTDERSTLDDRAGWRYLEAYNYGDGFVCRMTIAFNGRIPWGDITGKTEINGHTVRYRLEPPAAGTDTGGVFSAAFDRDGSKYIFSYTYKAAADAPDDTEDYDEAWQALYTLLGD